MQSKIQVLLLGTNVSVLSVFRRHRQEYLIRCLECDDASLFIESEPQPHLVILLRDDLHLCQQVRLAWSTLPLIMVSENTSEQHITTALDLGADDYVTIPFGEEEFLARIRALVRRMHARMPGEMQRDSEILTSQDGRIVLRIDAHQCMLAGREVRLTVTEFELLRVLMEHREKVLTHRFLLQRVWGPEYGEESDYLRIYVRQLRRKIEPDPSLPRYIVTEPGVGYVFRGSLEEADARKRVGRKMSGKKRFE
jgi:two-component system KDP operon response regulator KdpE